MKYSHFASRQSAHNPENHSRTSAVFHYTKKKKLPNGQSAGAHEVDMYFGIPASDDETLNPLEYWANNSQRFPALSMMARDYLAVPGTSAASERAFSAGRQFFHIRKIKWDPTLFAHALVLKAGFVRYMKKTLVMKCLLRR